MNDPHLEDTLGRYGYGKSGKGKTIVIVLLLLLLLATAGGAGWLATLWSDEQSRSLVMEQQLKSVSDQIAVLQNENSQLSSLLADKQAEIDRMREEWASQVETLESQHQEQLQRTYGQMNEIIYDSRKTLAYIGDIETRLRAGQNIDAEEARRLTNVVNGLAFLHEQYKKPLTEFRELDRYFTRQLESLPEQAVDPKESTPLARRIFKNKQFKEERNEFFENRGRRDAIEEARTVVSQAYSSAQRQMAAISLDSHKLLAQLDEITESNEASAADVEEFFQNSREILKIHENLMSVEPPSTPAIRP